MAKKVLIVDDSRTALLMTTSIVAQHTTYDVCTAADGLAAVQTALQERPDLILMDVVMPNMNGFEACDELRKHAETADVPVLLLTTRGEQECVEAGFISGCNEYLTKPVNPTELIGVLEAYLGA